MKIEDYESFNVGQTILNEMKEQGLVKDFLYEGLSDPIQQERINKVLQESTREEAGFLISGDVRIPHQTFVKVWEDPDGYVTAREVAEGLGISWSRWKDSPNPENAAKRALERIAMKFYKEDKKTADLSKFYKRPFKFGDEEDSSSFGPSKTRQSAPKNAVDIGSRNRKSQQVEKINDESILPGEFYTNMTRIPPSNHSNFLRFWDRDIAAVPSDRARFFGRKWKKSFIFGYEFSSTGFVYEVWYNSLDSTFSLHDKNAADVTGNRYNTLQEATKALFNAVRQNDPSDFAYMQNDATAASMFKAVSSSIDPHIQKMIQKEQNDIQDFRKVLDKYLKSFTTEEKEEFKRVYDPLLVPEEEIIEAAEKYSEAFDMLKEFNDQSWANAFRNSEFYSRSAKSFYNAVKKRYKAQKDGQEYKSPRDNIEKTTQNFKVEGQDKQEKYYRDLKDVIQKAPEASSILRTVDKLSDSLPEKIRELERQIRERINKGKEEIENLRTEHGIKGGVEVPEQPTVPTQQVNDQRRREINNILALLGKKERGSSDKIVDSFNRSKNYAYAIKKASELVLNTFLGNDASPKIKEVRNLYKQYTDQKGMKTDPTEDEFYAKVYGIVSKAVDDSRNSYKKNRDRSEGVVSEEHKIFQDIRDKHIQERFEDSLSDREKDLISDEIQSQHGVPQMRQMRKQAEHETVSFEAIKNAIAENIIEKYSSTRASRAELPNFFERNFSLLFPRGERMVSPMGYVKSKKSKASFMMGFSLANDINIEIWYVTEPNPDKSSKNKTISSFYVFDITSMRVLKKYIPYYRHALQYVVSKIGFNI